MKKTKKIILSVLAAVLAIALGIGLFFAAPMLAMKPAKTGLVLESYYLPISTLRSGRGNLYLIDTGDGYLMIDAGASIASVESGLAELSIDPAQVKWILLTHSHGDHVAALPLFPDAEVYIGEGESLPAAPQDIQFLSSGEVLLFGNIEVECIAAPGHTPGSMLYRVNKAYLFTGDALRWSGAGTNMGISVHPFTMDEAQARETIAALPDAWIVLTSHYGWYGPPISGS